MEQITAKINLLKNHFIGYFKVESSYNNTNFGFSRFNLTKLLSISSDSVEWMLLTVHKISEWCIKTQAKKITEKLL